MPGFLDRIAETLLTRLDTRLAAIHARLVAIEAALDRIERELPTAENLMRALAKSRGEPKP